MKDKYSEFIRINEEDKEHYHIYFNDNKENEIKSNSINENDNVSKIDIIIDYPVKSFYQLFSYCGCIESVRFKKFYRNNVTNMSCMFFACNLLKELNFNNFGG